MSSVDRTQWITPTADQSAEILTDHLKRRIPFFFIRYGDGALECIYGRDVKRQTCDGEVYSEDLAAALLDAWKRLTAGTSAVFAGDWQAASFGNGSGNNRELELWEALTAGVPFEWLHPEALLLMRESAALVDFYRAVKADRRRKVYMGPEKNAAAARFLGAFHLVTPMVPDLICKRAELLAGLDAFEPDVVLFGAGMAGNVVAVEQWGRRPEGTYISIGSALDPLFSEKSRAQQLSERILKRMFRGML